jgi:uncharacterized phiE125 gp8 family phage protein
MSTTILQAQFEVDGVLVDAKTAKLSDASGTYGIKRNDTGAVVVADDTDLTHDGTGLYSYSFTDPALDLTYTYALEFVYGDQTYRATGTIAGGTSATYPVTLAEAKAQCLIDHSDRDTELQRYIAAATEYCEGICNQTFIQRERVAYFQGFCDPRTGSRVKLELPWPPLVSVTSVKYLDTAGAEQTLSSSVYRVHTGDDLRGYVELLPSQSWPSTYGVSDDVWITCQAGYGSSPSDVPETVRQAILLMVSHMNIHRTPYITGPVISEVGKTVDSLLGLRRRIAI